MNNYEEYIGSTNGSLTVLKLYKKKRNWYFLCQCTCGNTKSVQCFDFLKHQYLGCKNKECYYGTNINSFIGEKFNKLIINKVFYEDGVKKCECKCECGKTVTTYFIDVIKGRIKSCGCSKKHKVKNSIERSLKKQQTQMENFSNRIGEKYGKLEIVDLCVCNQKIKYICKCDCGNLTTVNYSDLISNKTQSCGCIRKQMMSKLHTNKPKGYNWYFIYNNKKIQCRSSYEVLFANYLKKQNKQFLYEEITLRLPNKTCYTPDFYVKDTDIYYEVKGYIYSKCQQEKIEFLKQYNNIQYIYWEDLIEKCNLPYKTFKAYKNKAEKLNIKLEDYFALEYYHK